jgi:hypothetical protein
MNYDQFMKVSQKFSFDLQSGTTGHRVTIKTPSIFNSE